MAQGMKTGGRDFPTGVSGNPKGRPRASMEIEEIRLQSRLEVIETIARSLLMTGDELKESLVNPEATMAQLLVGSIINRAIEEGCPQRAQSFANYVLGRPRPYEAGDEQILQQQQNDRSREFLRGVPSSVLLELITNIRRKHQHNRSQQLDFRLEQATLVILMRRWQLHLSLRCVRYYRFHTKWPGALQKTTKQISFHRTPQDGNEYLHAIGRRNFPVSEKLLES